MNHCSRQSERPLPSVEVGTPSSPAPPAGPLRPGNLGAIRSLAISLHREGHLDDAESIYRRVLAADGDDMETLHHLGLLHHERGEPGRALALLQRAVRLRPDDPDVLRLLGEVYRALRRFDESIACSERALELAPDDPDTLCNLGHASLQSGRAGDAERCYRAALRHGPEDADCLGALGTALLRQGRPEEARRTWEQAVESKPQDEELAHLLAAVRGDLVRTAPRRYVIDLFDQYADAFDEELVEGLAYRVPVLLREAIERHAGAAGAPRRIIDLGCGTGLCGEQVRPLASHLVGVDVSTRMIERARRRGVYDVLIQDDLLAGTWVEPGGFDIALAGDVFIYVGALEEAFELCARALRPGGLLAFSTEHCPDDDLVLRPSGRFAHGDESIRSLASRSGFQVLAGDPITVRVEQGAGIPGRLFLLERTR